MKLEHYNQWIWNDIKEARLFTGLSVFGITINVAVVIIFLSIAVGVERFTIQRITEEQGLLLISASSSEGTRLPSSALDEFIPESDTVQIIPVVEDFYDLRIISGPGFSDRLNFVTTVFGVNRAEGVDDIRIRALNFISGGDINGESQIIISRSRFEQIAMAIPELNLSNYQDYQFELIATRISFSGEEQTISAPIVIAGVVEETPFNGVQAYVSPQLVFSLDNWQNELDELSPNAGYEQFEIIVGTLSQMREIRDRLNANGYTTQSIVDRIEDVEQVISIVRTVFLVIFSAAIVIATFNLVMTLTSHVQNHRKEIGILKSVGATDFQVQGIFVLHAVYLCTFGSILGVITAWIGVNAFAVLSTNLFPNIETSRVFSIEASYILLVVFLSIFIGSVIAFLPARRAALIEPIETLREQ